MSLVEYLETSDGTKDLLKCFNDIVNKYENIIAFGAGVGGAALYKQLKILKLEDHLVAWSDNNPLKIGRSYMDPSKKIIHPSSIVDGYGKDVGVVISSSAYDQIKEQLIGYGISEENIHLFNFAFMDLEYTDYQFIMDHIVDFERAYDRMEDQKSREIFVCILNYKISKDDKYLERLQLYVDDERLQYFDQELFEFRQDECFLDVGAYIGDTFSVFNNVYCGGWKKYYGIEADPYIYNELISNVECENFKEKCMFYNVATWDEKTLLYFDSFPGSSSIDYTRKNKIKVKADRIDDVVEGHVTLIKMDIEGAEYNALRGATKLIKRDKPILAICVYHKRDDYYILTDLIDNILPGEYKFYLRQYRYTPTETVCYAIPKHRVKTNFFFRIDKT